MKDNSGWMPCTTHFIYYIVIIGSEIERNLRLADVMNYWELSLASNRKRSITAHARKRDRSDATLADCRHKIVSRAAGWRLFQTR